METWYDKDEDILNVQLKGDYWKSIELNGVVIDVARDGSILSFCVATRQYVSITK